jgi:hypothetical protein
MSEKLPTPQFVAMLRAQAGKRGVYRATGVLAPVIIEEVRCGADFEAKLVPVEGIVLYFGKAAPQYPEVLNVGAVRRGFPPLVVGPFGLLLAGPIERGCV